MFYVVDQSMMRSPRLMSIIQTQQNASFVVPDTSLVEMVKSTQWENTMRGSFAAFSSALSRTFISISVPEAIRIERTSRRSVDRKMLLMEDGTYEMREIIQMLASGAPGLAEIRRRIDALRSDLLSEEADPVAEKGSLERIVKALVKECGPQMVADLRSGRMNRTAQLGLIRVQAAKLLRKNEPLSQLEARALIRSRALLLRFYYLKLRYANWWVTRGGLETAKPTTVLNHRLDQEYILIGSFFDETLTKDQDQAEAASDLRRLIDKSEHR
jgi:hypothetical protein